MEKEDRKFDANAGMPAVKQELDAISPSFCAAKWKQVTVHLAIGHTHSCHHPVMHKIPLDEIKVNPTAIHNTNFKKQQRKMMLEGARPPECDYCWRVEDTPVNEGDEVFSDRVTKSSEHWSRPYIEEIKNAKWDDDANPTYFEISFSNVCNFKCSYCSPEVSSKWLEEIQQHGHYQLHSFGYNNLDYLKQIGKYPIPEREENPYVDAFWKWWPDLVKGLKVFRITGGEPLLSKHTYRVLEYLIENPQPDLELDINSNLCIPDELFERFIERMVAIQERKAIKSFKLYTSCEAHGKKAEYIRNGMDYNKWLKNCNRVLNEIEDSKLTIMSTYNVLSVSSFTDFMKDVLTLKEKYTVQPTRPHPVSLDIPYLRWPNFMSSWLIPRGMLKYVEDSVTYMYKNMQQTYWLPLCGKGYFDYEISRMKRIFRVIEGNHQSQNSSEMAKSKADFYAFVNEHDRRRGTNFLEVFPEYSEFYNDCKSTYDSLKNRSVMDSVTA